MRKFIPVLVLMVPLWAQLYMIDQPTPISLMHGEYFLNARLQNEGGMVAHFAVGLFDRATIGASYGGNSFIGSTKPTFFPYVGFQARFAITNEDEFFLPDISIGFDNQGFGDYDDTYKQYQVRMKGFYLSVGKTSDWTNTYFVFGPNYWKSFSGFLAVKQMLAEVLNLILEYDLNLNDDHDKNRGFLNCGFSWNFSEELKFTIMLKDLLGNRDRVNDKEAGMNRAINLSFIQLF
ncbi:MAG: hypothetical protein OEW70_08295 [candidate division WOR-3 bacterium]|nr:hypothetical protein [candidate division WOR-3 bacterium]